MTSRLGLSSEHERIVRDVLAQHLPPGVSVRVFGSRARGSHKPYSDLDLALKGGDRLSFAAFAGLSHAFSESDLPFKVDVVDCRSVDAGLEAAIDRDGVEL